MHLMIVDALDLCNFNICFGFARPLHGSLSILEIFEPCLDIPKYVPMIEDANQALFENKSHIILDIDCAIVPN